MKEDNGTTPQTGGGAAKRSPHFTDLRGTTPQQPSGRINLDKYRPAREIEAEQRYTFDTSERPESIAIAANDPDWQNNPLMDTSSSRDISGSDDYYPDDDEVQFGPGGGSDDDAPGDGSDANGGSDGKPPRRNPFAALAARIKGMSRKQWLITGGVVLVLAVGVTSFLLTRPSEVETVSSVQKAKKPVEVAKPTSPLTGLETSEEDTKRPVIGTMIENSTFARPQSGLKDAGVVYEAIAEYGITRFLTLYQEAAPGNIGPVRSARPYYVDWAHSYDAAYAHVGGSPDALNKIKADGVRDLDQFFNAGTYHRISQREAPHNVYTSAQKLRELTASKKYDSSKFDAWPRKKEAAAKAPTATAIDIAISGPTYNVHYDYDAASNSYKRVMGGAPHTDADSGAQLAPKVVIGLATPYSLMSDGYHSSYVTTGTGTAKIFQDGTYTEATWKREGNGTYQFLDKDSKPVKLDPGQTWVTVVGDPNAVKYTGPAPAPTPAGATTKPQ